MKFKIISCSILLVSLLVMACSQAKKKQGEEQISISPTTEFENERDSLLNSIDGNMSMKQISSFPSKVILTGLQNHRLVSIYKAKSSKKANEYASYSYASDESEDELSNHFMPGIDILFGYNLLNIAHYDLKTEQGNYLFGHPVLIKTLYYPSYIQDSMGNQPINRDYYMVSVYDQDTNHDSLINKRDLRRFYCFDASSINRKQLLPSDYSVERSQYDKVNDIMYLFARQDTNKNGTAEKTEPVHVFWLNLKAPDAAKILY